jgi:uroporphyrin-III C-methyltransferase/precorrin-2 dehydrogenase/sirohydrochlorin ferrochelatase
VSQGTVYLVGAGPGDPGLMTRRALELIASADAILYDRLIPPGALDGARPDADLRYVGKQPGGESMDQGDINALLVELGGALEVVVRLKGGDPFVFARGYEEVLACAEAGIPVTVVPGVTSAIAVPEMAGVPVTHRAVNHEFVVVSGHLAPNHPESLVNWNALAAMSGTIVLLMAVERIELFAEILLAGGRPADTPVVVVQQGTTAGERIVRATLADVAETVRAEVIRPPAIIVIGRVAAFGA